MVATCPVFYWDIPFSGPSVLHPIIILVGMPVVSFLVLPCAACTHLELKCVVFCTFAGVSFLAESVLESRNLQSKFQIFFLGDIPGRDPYCGNWQPPPTPTLSTDVSAMCGGKCPW